jgi:hypothetical protein
MNRDEEVRDIITQLQGLQLQQTALISRLGRLSTSGESSETPAPAPPAPPTQQECSRSVTECESGIRGYYNHAKEG